MTGPLNSAFSLWWPDAERQIHLLGKALLRSEEAASELSQDVAIAALTQLEKEPLCFSDRDHFFAWCRKRARWLGIDRIRHASRLTMSNSLADVVNAQPAADELLMHKEALSALKAAIAQLPAMQKDVVLGILRGDPNAQLAARLGVTEATVRSHYRHARLQLTNLLEQFTER